MESSCVSARVREGLKPRGAVGLESKELIQREVVDVSEGVKID